MIRGERIRNLRLNNDLTLEKLGEKIGVGKGTVKKYESGSINNIPSDKIEALADALETSPEYLMGWTDNPEPNPVLPQSSDEEELVRDFTLLPPDQQRQVLEFAKFLLSSHGSGSAPRK